MIRISSALLILSGTLGLTACGGNSGPSEFVSKSTASCVKENGQQAANYCACNVRLFDEMLDEKDKRYFVTVVMNEDIRLEDVVEETRKSGFTEADMRSMAAHLAAVKVRSDKECPK